MGFDPLDSPPLHRRFDEQKALRQIAERYQGCRGRIPTQVKMLQDDEDFCALCQQYYAMGYKDWMILMAILNCVLNWKLQARGVKLAGANVAQLMRTQMHEVNDDSYPVWRFDREMMDLHLQIFHMIALKAYGFDLRRRDYHPKCVERFLRCHMRHFDLDLAHEPMFGETKGEWPQA